MSSKNITMVFTGAIDPKRRAYIAFLTRDKRVRTMDIVKRCKVSWTTVYRIKNDIVWTKRKNMNEGKGGRPKKLSERDERKLLRTLNFLEKKKDSFRLPDFWNVQAYYQM